MSGLNLVMGCSTDIPCPENFLHDPSSEKANIIAFAVVDKGKLAEEDVTEFYMENPGSGIPTPNEVIDVVRDLQVIGKAMYFPNGYINGIQPKPEEKLASVAFGTSTDPKPTGDVTNMVQLTYKNMFSTQTIKWFNGVRKNIKKYDIVYWTESKVFIVQGEDVTFHNIGYDITGNAADTIYGGFDVKWIGEGQPVPYGPIDKTLLDDFTKLTISNPTLDADDLALSNCQGGDSCKVFTAVAGGALTTTMAFAISSLAPCITWSIFRDCEYTPLASNATPVKINPLTGLVTITSLTANTSNKYRVVAVADSCVVGEYCMKIVTKPA